jgi:flagellar hook-associated protein 1 FlgK
VSYYADPRGSLTLRGPGDVLLVEGQAASQFLLQKNGADEGMYDILIAKGEGVPENITQKILEASQGGGTLKGLLSVRDGVTKRLIQENNSMASGFIQRFNEVHGQGFGLGDFNKIPHIKFFEPVQDPKSAAQNMKVSDAIVNATDAICASSTRETQGDNVNLNRLLELKNERFLSDGRSHLTEYYANYVGVLGVEAQKSRDLLSADQILHTEISGKKDSISGVSLDEEATNLIRWQTAFTASSKVITTVDEMLETVLSLKR